MTELEERLQRCEKLISDPLYRRSYLESAKSRGRAGLAGYFSNFIPCEILTALGLHPTRIIGRLSENQPPQVPMSGPLCAFVRDSLAAAQSGGLDYFDLVVFPHTCDALKVLLARWPAALAGKVEALAQPVKTGDTAVEYFAAELSRFSAKLSSRFGRRLLPDDLRKAISDRNQTRGLLRKLYARHASEPRGLPMSRLIAVVTAGYIMESEIYNALLRDLDAPFAAPAAGKPYKRIIIAGPLMADIKFLREIEAMGAVIVHDELSNGSRSVLEDVGTEGDPYRNLANAYLKSARSPTLDCGSRCQDIVLSETEKCSAGGVLYLVQASCEPHIFGYLESYRQLKARNIRCQLVEVDNAVSGMDDRQRLKIESFLTTVEAA